MELALHGFWFFADPRLCDQEGLCSWTLELAILALVGCAAASWPSGDMKRSMYSVEVRELLPHRTLGARIGKRTVAPSILGRRGEISARFGIFTNLKFRKLAPWLILAHLCFQSTDFPCQVPLIRCLLGDALFGLGLEESSLRPRRLALPTHDPTI